MRLFNKREENEIDELNVETQAAEEVSEDLDMNSDIGKRLVEEDALLVQIDAFREKAETLQALINDRQAKVIELENVVQEKEDKNIALRDELQHKQEALEGVLDDIKAQLNIFADRVDTSVSNAVTVAKEPIMEKVHTENVRLYRNLYDFVKEEYNKDEINKMLEKAGKSGKGFMLGALIFSIVNTAILVFLLLSVLGIVR